MDLRYPILAFLLLIFCSCDDVVDVIPDNEPTSDFNISDIKIENYVNRLYIDLIGREPTDIELQVNFDSLKATNLGREKRQEIITKLMTDTTPQINEGSYKEAYYLNLYNRAKVRCLENITDASIRQERGLLKGGAMRDSLNMLWKKYYLKQEGIRRYDLLLRSREDLLAGRITYTEMMSVVIDNPIYDKINMNTFNFVRATFDELLWRLPTEQEYNASFDMIEHALARELFEQFGSDKDAYIAILSQSWGMKEGMVIWAFQSFLNRFPESDELYSILAEFATSDDINYVIAEILLTDEYANFR